MYYHLLVANLLHIKTCINREPMDNYPVKSEAIKPPVVESGSSSKPFGSKLGSKPNFMSKVKDETQNARQHISQKPF